MGFFDAVSKGLSDVGQVLTGNSNDAGILGVGQYKTTGVPIDESAYRDQTASNARRADFANQLSQANARLSPTFSAGTVPKANTITAANLGNANTVQGSNIGPMQNAQTAMIDQAQQAQFRNQQAGLAAQLQAQANGQGPSIATQQLKDATDRNIAQAMALQASGRGQNVALGMKSAAEQAAAANQQAAGQAGQLRLQEQMGARDQLGNVLGQARTSDIGLATNQAQLGQQANIFNAQSQNDAAIQQAGLNQQANLSNQQAMNNFAIDRANLGQQASMANQDALNAFNLKRADLGQQMTLANQQSELQQRGLNDAQSRFFNTGISNLDTQDRSSLQDLQQLRVNQQLGNDKINEDAYKDASSARGKAVGGIGEALGIFYKGGRVPGKPEVPGDSPINDSQVRALSPGEVVIPRTAAKDAKSAKDFVDKLFEAERKNKRPSDDELKQAFSSRRRSA